MTFFVMELVSITRGLARSDRFLMEKMFAQGYIRVLCTTATLAWGINLPAHTVVIKGTQYYDAKKGGFVDVGVLDVLQVSSCLCESINHFKLRD